MTEEYKKMLFQKYLNNDCSEEEWQTLRGNFSDSSSNDTFNDLINIEMQKYLLEDVSIDLRISNEMLGNIVGQINKDENPKVTVPKSKYRRFPERRKFLQVAASTLFIIALSFTVYQLGEEKFTATRTSAYIERTTAIGEYLEINLPDGSKVSLNNASKIKYLKEFSSESREVFLEGEAYFEVKKDRSKPFIVHASGIQTKVLGTAFNIHAYKDLSTVAVSVMKGRVAISDSLSSFGLLEKDQQIEIDKRSKVFVKTTGKSTSVVGWREGQLLFDQATFLEVRSVLHKKFGVEMKFESENLKNCRFTASFDKDEKPFEILDMLNLLHGTSYRLENNVIVISGNGCELNLN